MFLILFSIKSLIEGYLCESGYTHSILKSREFSSSKIVLKGKARVIREDLKGRRPNKSSSSGFNSNKISSRACHFSSFSGGLCYSGILKFFLIFPMQCSFVSLHRYGQYLTSSQPIILQRLFLNIEHFYEDTQLFKQILMPLECSSGALFSFEQLMEKLNFDYSLKNILTPNNIRYKLKLIKKFGSPQNVLGSLLLSKPGRKVGTGKDYL